MQHFGDDEIAMVKQLARLAAERVAAIDRDGLANSKAHVERIDQCVRAIHAILAGEKPELPI